jgi:hypothetical protein
MYLGDDDDDMIGDDEILGAELGDDLDQILSGDEILGLDRRRTSSLARLAAARRAGGVLLKRKQDRDAQEQVLPFPATSVSAATTATILAFPQRKFRTERFVVSSQIAEFFTINDLRIGRESMMVSVGQAPAQGFAEVGVGVRLRGYTANLGNTIGLDVTNLDPANAHTFLAMIVGTAVF